MRTACPDASASHRARGSHTPALQSQLAMSRCLASHAPPPRRHHTNSSLFGLECTPHEDLGLLSHHMRVEIQANFVSSKYHEEKNARQNTAAASELQCCWEVALQACDLKKSFRKHTGSTKDTVLCTYLSCASII